MSGLHWRLAGPFSWRWLWGRVFGFHEFNLVIRSLRIVHRVFLIAVGGLRARMSFLRFETTGSQDSGALWDLMESCAEDVGGTRVELTIENDKNLTVNTVAHVGCRKESGQKKRSCLGFPL